MSSEVIGADPVGLSRTEPINAVHSQQVDRPKVYATGHEHHTLNRRTLLRTATKEAENAAKVALAAKIAASLSAVGATTAVLTESNPDSRAGNAVSKVNRFIGEKEHYDGSELFINSKAAEIVEKLGLRPKNFMFEKERLPNEYSAHKGERLLPVFPPKVLGEKRPDGTNAEENRAIMYTLAEQNGIGVNIIAALMTVQTLGDEDNNQPGETYGPFAIGKGLFQEGSTEKDFKNKDLSSEIAVKRLINKLKEARKYNKDAISQNDDNLDFDANDVIWALMAFENDNNYLRVNQCNPSELRSEIDRERYYQYASLIHTMELSNELRKAGQTDDEITQSLISEELDKRCQALDDNSEYYLSGEHQQESVVRVLGVENVVPQRNPYEKPILDSYNGKLKYTYPLNAGLRRINAILTKRFVKPLKTQSRPEEFRDLKTENPNL